MSLRTRARSAEGSRCPRCHGDDSRRLGPDLARGQKSPKAASFHQIKRCALGTADEGERFSRSGGPRRFAHSPCYIALGAYHRVRQSDHIPPYNCPPLICLLCVYSRVVPLLSVVLFLQFRCPTCYLAAWSGDSLKREFSRETIKRNHVSWGYLLRKGT